MLYTRIKDESGLSIIEVIIAASILAIGLISVMGVMASSMKTTEVLNSSDTAEAAAMAKLEEVKTFSTVDFYGIYDRFNSVSYTSDDFKMLRGLDTGVCTVTVDNSNPDLLNVTATVTWQDIQGSESYELKTMLCRSD